MPIEFSNTELTELKPRIAVVGVGGAGCNAVNNMILSSLQGVDFVVANTDAQALANSEADNRIQLGVEITQGLGAGAQPSVGEAAAEEAVKIIDETLEGCHMAFITAGMGGGTGTGAAPVVARRAREKKILTVGVVTKPFQFEGSRRMKIAEAGIQELAGHVDTLIIIPNQNLFRVANEKTTFADAFNMADEVLHSGVRGITDLMVMPGLINLDFADVRTVMEHMGKAMMGTGEAEGENRAQDAAAAAISNPLLEEASLQGAQGVIINVTGGMDMTLYEVDEAVNMVREQVDPDALIVFGSAFNESLDGKLRVSVVATGIEGSENGVAVPRPSRAPVTPPQPRNVDNGGDEKTAAETAPDEKPTGEDTAPAPAAREVAPDRSEAAAPTPQAAASAPHAETASRAETAPQAEQPSRQAPDPAPAARAGDTAPTDEQYDIEARAVAASQDAGFTAEAPKTPKVSNQPLEAADPMKEAAYTGRRDTGDNTRSSEGGEKRDTRLSMFARRSRRKVQPNPVNDQADTHDAGTHGEGDASLGGVSVEDRPAPENRDRGSEQLEIPSFLRRQQN
ncbi:cell division protein FtsZ [Yunchengibacter salinarum]|uniref:cell division protein FtsZ n=1 Tax=Yunchengibacter salinarum TaxID=3133399 RepID=UPI0035B67D84